MGTVPKARTLALQFAEESWRWVCSLAVERLQIQLAHKLRLLDD